MLPKRLQSGSNRGHKEGPEVDFRRIFDRFGNISSLFLILLGFTIKFWASLKKYIRTSWVTPVLFWSDKSKCTSWVSPLIGKYMDFVTHIQGRTLGMGVTCKVQMYFLSDVMKRKIYMWASLEKYIWKVHVYFQVTPPFPNHMFTDLKPHIYFQLKLQSRASLKKYILPECRQQKLY